MAAGRRASGAGEHVTRFIIHVGPHKTGTSYLQEAFALCRGQLADRGIHYPTIWGHAAHHALYDRLRSIPNQTLEAEFAELHAARHPAVLISVEGLTSLPEPAIVYLGKLIGRENPVSAVYYVRAWADILPSHWKEAIKGGGTETLPEYLYNRLQNPTNSFFVNFGVGLRIWARQFGEDAIKLAAYDQLVATKRDLFEHFARQFLDWPNPPELELPPANVSPGPAEIEAIRAIAILERMRLGRALPRIYAQRLANRYMERKAELVPEAVRTALDEHRASLFISETGPALAALHRALFTEFSYALVQPRLANFFFRPRRAEISYVHPNWLLSRGVLDQLREIQETLRTEMEAVRRRAGIA
jgi:hypothetical protein